MNAQTTTPRTSASVNSYYEGNVWFTKERDDYGRTVRRVKSMTDGKITNHGVVVCVPRWTKETEAQYGIKRYFTNDWVKGDEIRQAGGDPKEALTEYDTLKAALQQWGCGTKEYQMYPKAD